MGTLGTKRKCTGYVLYLQLAVIRMNLRLIHSFFSITTELLKSANTNVSVHNIEAKLIMKHTLEPLLTVEDIMVIFLVSRVTVYRWHRLAKEGRSRFPLAIGDTKQGLRWSREAILAYQNANNLQPVKIESANERKKRHATACESLRRHGVKINNANKKEPQT